MPKDISPEEKQNLFNGYLKIISDPVNNPDEFFQAGTWIADPRNRVSVRRFEDTAMQGRVDDPYRSLLREYHDDLLEEMPVEELDSYRLQQMGHIILSNN